MMVCEGVLTVLWGSMSVARIVACERSIQVHPRSGTTAAAVDGETEAAAKESDKASLEFFLHI